MKGRFVHIHKEKPHHAWQNITKKFGSGFEFYDIEANADTEQLIKQQLLVKNANYPMIKYFDQGDESKKKKSKTIFQNDASFEEIFKDISEIYQHNVRGVSEKELQISITVAVQDKKTAVVLFHDKELLLMYKTLSNHLDFENDLVFLSFKNPPKSVQDQFNVHSYPTILFIFYEGTIDDLNPFNQ